MRPLRALRTLLPHTRACAKPRALVLAKQQRLARGSGSSSGSSSGSRQ